MPLAAALLLAAGIQSLAFPQLGGRDAPATGPDLTVTTLTLDEVSAERIDDRDVIRHVGTEPPPVDQRRDITAYFSPDNTVGPRARRAGGRLAPAASNPAPGRDYADRFHVTRKPGDGRFLVVTVRVAGDVNPSNDAFALALREASAVPDVSPPAPARSPDDPSAPGGASGVGAGVALEIESLALIERSAERIRYRCVIRNVGTAPTNERTSVLVQAYLAADRQGTERKTGAGGRPVLACGDLAPGAACEGVYDASVREAESRGQRFLVVHVRHTGAADAVAAVALDAPLADLPSPGSRLGVPNPPPTGWEIPDWFGWLWFGLIGSLLLGGFALVGWAIISGIGAGERREKRFPPRFRPAPTPFADADADPNFDEAAEAPPDADRPRRQAVADRIGFELLERAPNEARMALKADAVAAVMRKRTKRGEYLLCDARKEQRQTSSTGESEQRSTRSWTTISHQTALIFVAVPGVRFPSFGASPNLLSGPVAWMYRRRYGLTFPDDPEFSRLVTCGAKDRDAARPLLTPELRAVLMKHADLTVQADGDTVTVSADVPVDRPRWGLSTGRDGDRVLQSRAVHLDDRPAFFKAAAEVVKAMCNAEAATRATRATTAENAEPTASTNILTATPGAGTVSRDKLDRFLREPAPRRVPRAARWATRRLANAWKVFAGLIMLLIASGLTVVIQVVPEEEVGDLGRVGATLMLVTFLLLPGAGMVLWGTVTGWRARRLLRLGRVTTAQIAAVEATGSYFTSGNVKYHEYLAAFAYLADGERREVALPFYGRHAERAQRRFQAGGPTRVLVHPTAPTRLTWIDALLPDAEHVVAPAVAATDGPPPEPPEGGPPPADWTDDPRAERYFGRLVHAASCIGWASLLSVAGAVVLNSLFGPTGRAWGWGAGLLFGLVGYPLGWLKPAMTEDKNWRNREPARRKRHSVEAAESGGMFAAAIVAVIVGVILLITGLCVTGSVLLSPFSPESWRDALQSRIGNGS